MSTHLLGEITLSISMVLYLTWLLPQLRLNFVRKSTEGLSFWMHMLLFLGYFGDLLYGFGREMEWQYRLVTSCSLFFLTLQHVQFAYYNPAIFLKKIGYRFISVAALCIFLYVLFDLIFFMHTKFYYDMAGFLSDIVWTIYAVPQIFKNHQLKSTEGLSTGFVLLGIALTGLDTVSAFTLQWDWPSIVSIFSAFFMKGFLCFQIVYYQKSRIVALQ